MKKFNCIMENLLIVANWKSNKTISEAKDWLQGFTNYDLRITNKEIIVCPPFTLLGILRDKIREVGLPIKLGAQDISPFEQGARTGDVNGKQIKEFAEYVLVGHSERRKNFNEDDAILSKKVYMAIENNLIPIFCVPNAISSIPQGVSIVAYEPIEAIGTGNPDSPENADEVAKKIKEDNARVTRVLYGGSVNADNVDLFTKSENINGVLVGKESLDPLEFLKIIQNA